VYLHYHPRKPAVVKVEDIIDPLEEVKASSGTKGIIRRPKSIKKEGTVVSLGKEALIAIPDDDDSVGLSPEQRITLQQATILKTLPSEFFLGFRDFADQLVPRFAFITVTIHIMLLIPILQVMKFSLGMNIAPLLYMAPLLFLFPYVAFWLWENDRFEIPIFDEKVKTYIKTQKLVAEEILQKDEDSLYRAVKSSGDPDSTQRLAYLQLLAKVDVDILCDEVLAVKSRVAAQQSRKSGTAEK
jgi:hypothetical protein